MRILVAGGLHSPTAGYDNAVVSLAKTLSPGNNVCAVALTNFPLPSSPPPPVPFEIRHPRLSFHLVGRSVANSYGARRAVARYMDGHSAIRVLSMIRYSINFSHLQSVVEGFHPDAVQVHSIDIERLGFLDLMLQRTDVPLLVTIHGLYSL